MADDRLVTAEALGKWLGVSNSAVQEATARGVLKKAGRGRWALKRNGSAYCDHMRKLKVCPKGQGHAARTKVSKRLTVNHAIVGEAISVYGAPEDLAPRVVTPADLPECDVLALDCEGAEILLLRQSEISSESNRR